MKLSIERWGVTFQNPVLLAAGTCGFGEELREVVDLEALGGFVTKSVTIEPRHGNPAPRVAEIGPTMINSIGLANPGLERVKAEHAGRTCAGRASSSAWPVAPRTST